MKKDENGMPIKTPAMAERIRTFLAKKNREHLLIILLSVSTIALLILLLVFALAKPSKTEGTVLSPEQISYMEAADALELAAASIESSTAYIKTLAENVVSNQETLEKSLQELSVLNLAFLTWAEEQGLVTKSN